MRIFNTIVDFKTKKTHRDEFAGSREVFGDRLEKATIDLNGVIAYSATRDGADALVADMLDRLQSAADAFDAATPLLENGNG